MGTLQALLENMEMRHILGKYVKGQGGKRQKLHSDHQLALF